jgi:rSAM/selenodomain-associated transferase 2
MDVVRQTRDVAVVIPVFRDTAALGRLLDAISTWELAPQEILVIDGGGDRDVAALCRQHGCACHRTTANRGAQLDLGARQAAAPVLWFLHADAQVGVGALRAISAAVARGVRAGGFRFRFQGRRTVAKRLIEALVALRIRLGGTIYGDQGIFVLRDLYLELGGFPHEPLFEEVSLIRKLRARGSLEVLDGPFYVATHRWERDGYLRRSLRNRWLALGHALGVPVSRLNSAYRGAAGKLENSSR